MRSLLLLALLCPRSAAEEHPCARKAASDERPFFFSACPANNTSIVRVAAGAPLRMWACVRHSAGGNSFVGRATNGSLVYALSFDDGQPVEVGAYACTPGRVHGLDVGSFELRAVHDYTAGTWDMPWHQQEGTLFGAPDLPPVPPSTAEVAGDERLWVHGELVWELPPCTNDWYGRFVGSEYDPMHCTMRHVSYPQLVVCLASLGAPIALLGDSNSRRTMKKLYSAGKWCSEPDELATDHCLCEDDPGGNERHVAVGREVWSSVDYGNGAVLRFNEWHGDWQDPIEQWRSAPRAVVVLAGLGAWPLANDSLPDFKSRVAHVMAQLPRRPGWVYVVRTAPYSCCSARENTRRYTSRRSTLFRDALVRIFLGAFPGGLVWDTAAVSEALSMGDIGRRCDRCASSHLSGELVEADAAVLRHLLCGITFDSQN